MVTARLQMELELSQIQMQLVKVRQSRVGTLSPGRLIGEVVRGWFNAAVWMCQGEFSTPEAEATLKVGTKPLLSSRAGFMSVHANHPFLSGLPRLLPRNTEGGRVLMSLCVFPRSGQKRWRTRLSG